MDNDTNKMDNYTSYEYWRKNIMDERLAILTLTKNMKCIFVGKTVFSTK